MKTYHERTEDVLAKIEHKKKVRRITRIAITATVTAILALVLFLPYTPPSVRQYAGSPYYALIQKINTAQYGTPKHANRFETLLDGILSFGLTSNSAPGAVVPAPGAPSNDMAGDGVPEENYQEITDNQVQGVIEGDLIKRSDKYI